MAPSSPGRTSEVTEAQVAAFEKFMTEAEAKSSVTARMYIGMVRRRCKGTTSEDATISTMAEKCWERFVDSGYVSRAVRDGGLRLRVTT